VKGDGVYEVPVGPIHAGIIEPGHFRFSCLGEVIQNLEIRLGYVHRGVEEAALKVPWRHVRFVAESACSDTTIGNALAHALAIEQIIGLPVPQGVVRLRAVALEMERVASHVGDLGGVSGDIGFAAGAAIFGRLRGSALGLLERLTGSRFGTAYILPGGIGRPLTPALRDSLLRETDSVALEYRRSEPLLMGNAGAVERMEGTGRVKTSLAKEFGLVGPAGRASGIDYDVRSALRQEPYGLMMGDVPLGKRGDVLDRVQVKTQETRASLAMISHLLEAAGAEKAPETEPLPQELPASQVGVGIVEAWRGELTHAVFTDARCQISRYAIRGPSFNNWTGLSIAVRGELLSDFPLCNKSFGLSYSGNDL
jgi:Ni,Fe-hydrogenase III large subunit